ncbi:hypothetical protein WAF17_10110 [Bernardetia sp. ABR2-2B]|uniref:hypothetical protein n=1 Tax=Bernardetia sp. ABR2-2B TaxID=3127472 RepID=UPI0030D21BAE
MMNQKNQIIELIKAAISSPPNEFTRSFCYDTTNQTFFVIHALDYFMLNENLEIDVSAESSMPTEAQKEIVGWIQRIEKNDDSIIRIPQKGITDQELKQIEFQKFIEENGIDLNLAKLQKAESKISISFDLENIETSKPSKIKKWWQFWK